MEGDAKQDMEEEEGGGDEEQGEILSMDFPEVAYDGAVYRVADDDAGTSVPTASAADARAAAYVAAMQNIDGPVKAFYCLLLCCSSIGTRLPRDLRVLLYGYLLKMWPVPRWPRNKFGPRGAISLPSHVVLQVPATTSLTPVFMRQTTFGYRGGWNERATYVYKILWAFDDAALAARLQRIEQWLLNSVTEEVRKGFLSSVRPDNFRKGWVLFSRHSSSGYRPYAIEPNVSSANTDIVKMSRGTLVIAIGQPLQVPLTIHISGLYSFKTGGYPQKRISRLAYFFAGPTGAKFIGD